MCFLSCKGKKEKTTIEKDNDRLFHYWDNFNYNETISGTQRDMAERTFVDYIGMFPDSPIGEIEESIYSFMDKAKSKEGAFVFFKNLFEKYLYNPNSPMRNDLFYEPALQYFLKSDKVDHTEKIKYHFQLQMVKKNKPGSKASLFFYRIGNGKIENLNEIESPYTLLIFYVPGCNSCEQIIRKLKISSGINELIRKRMLKIVAIYPEGNEKVWKAYRSNIPSDWINGLDWDRRISKGNIYDLKASPTIYLLDKEKVVLLKDADFSQVGFFLEKLYSRTF